MSVLLQGLRGKLHHILFGEEPVTDCFLCGKSVVPGRHLLFDTPGSAALPMHADCLKGRSTLQVAVAYHLKLTELANASRKAMEPHLTRGVVKAGE